MLNNKGQSLILFVIVLPILLVVLVLVIDIGKVISLKQELDNINKIVLDYGLDNLSNENDLSEDVLINDNLNNSNNDININMINDISDIEHKLIDLVKLNNNDIDFVDVRIVDSKIYMKLNENVNGIFSSLIDMPVFDVKSYYVGYMDNDRKIIERVNGW